MRVSCIVLSYNSARYLETCVHALAGALPASAEPSEIWVVENGSTDASPAILRQLQTVYPELLRVLYLDHNTGTTVSRNQALRHSTGRYVLVLDSDVKVAPGTIEPLLRRLDDDPRCGLVAPRLNYPDGRLQKSTDVFPTVTRKAQRFLSLRRMERDEQAAAPSDEVRPVDYAISAFWALRRNVINAVGPLDERIFYAPEDVDYCLRIWQAGYKVMYDPAVQAIHDAQEISRGWRLNKATLRHAAGLAYYFHKHRYAFSRERLDRRLDRSLGTRDLG